MTTPLSALMTLSGEDEAILPLERMADILLENRRKLPNLAKEGKITDVQVQQVRRALHGYVGSSSLSNVII